MARVLALVEGGLAPERATRLVYRPRSARRRGVSSPPVLSVWTGRDQRVIARGGHAPYRSCMGSVVGAAKQWLRGRTGVERQGTSWRRLWSFVGVAVVAISLLTGQLLIWIGAVQTRGGLAVYARGIDFMATLTGARILRDGDGRRLYDLAMQRAAQHRVVSPYLTLGDGVTLPYNHPPFEALLLAPLLDLPYAVLYAGWVLAALLAVELALSLLLRAVSLPPPARWMLALLSWSFPPLHQALWLGQNSPFVLLGLCGTYVALKWGRQGWAGCALLLVALKPQLVPLVVVLLMLLGAWRALAVAGGLLAILSVTIMPWLGPTWPLQYGRYLATLSQWGARKSIYPEIMPTFRGLAVNLLAGRPGIPAMPLFAALSSVAVGALCWSGWRLARSTRSGGDGDQWRRDLLWALGCVVMVLTAFHLNIHDLTVLLLPAWIIAGGVVGGEEPRWWSRRWLTLLWSGYAVSVLFLVMNQRQATVALLMLGVLAVGAGTVVWRLVGGPASEGAPPAGLVRRTSTVAG